MINWLIRDIELYLEIDSLVQLGLSEEEISGFIDFYIESWDFVTIEAECR